MVMRISGIERKERLIIFLKPLYFHVDTYSCRKHVTRRSFYQYKEMCPARRKNRVLMTGTTSVSVVRSYYDILTNLKRRLSRTKF